MLDAEVARRKPRVPMSDVEVARRGLRVLCQTRTSASSAFQLKCKPEQLRVPTQMRACELRVSTLTRACKLCVSTQMQACELRILDNNEVRVQAIPVFLL